MSQNRLHQYRQRLSRLFGSLVRFSPHRIVRHFKAVSSRLDAIIRLIEAGAAAGVDRDSKYSVLVQNQLGELGKLEERLGAIVTAAADQLGCAQQARTDELLSIIKTNVDAVNSLKDTIDSWNVDRWKLRECEGLLRNLRRQEYLGAIRDGRLAVPRLETDHPVAVGSLECELPCGSEVDNAIMPRFNHRLYELFGGPERLRVLDLGCRGGGFVRSLIDDGHFAVGLEASDYRRVNQAAEWSTIPMHLFTCDISKPFQLTDSVTNDPVLFDVITAWEVVEQIPAESLRTVFENLDRHLAPGGCALFSIVTFFDWDDLSGGARRFTVKPRSWWENKFMSLGFEIDDQHPISKDDWLRGSGQCRGDWHEDQGLGFHVVLRKKAVSAECSDFGGVWRASVA